jgi:hypothetical protein
MLQKRVLVTCIAFFLLIAGLFLLYHSNINKTVYLDISAEKPLVINFENSAEGVVITKNSEKKYTVKLPSAFLYQTKTIRIQNTENEKVQLKFYSRQKKDGDKTIKFSVDIKDIVVNGKSYNSKKQTIWFERPCSLDILTEKDETLSLSVRYKTKFMLRNAFLPTLIASIVLLICSISLFYICWYKTIEEKLYALSLFTDKKLLISGYECNLKKIITTALWLFLVGFCSFYILKNANWILGDDTQFYLPVMLKKYINSPIFASIGRFFPLAFQEFNLLFLFSLNDPFWFYCISCLEFFITVLFFTLFLKELSERYIQKSANFWSILFLFCLIVSPSVLYVFMDVIFPERNILCLLSIFMYFYWKGIQSENIIYTLLASLFAVLSCYYKEPVFGIFVVFCLSPFIFDYKNVLKQHKIFAGIISVNIILYCLLYYFLVYQFTVKGYNEARVNLTYIENIIFIFKNNFLLLLIVLFSCFRFLHIVFYKEKKYLISDSLLFSGTAYLFAFILLKLNAQYYFTPVYILALPALFLFILSLKSKTLALLCCICFLEYEYKNFYEHVYPDISKIQHVRLNDMKSVDFLCKKINSGYEIFYFQVKNIKPENTFNNVLMDYWRSVLEKFITGQLGYEYKIKVVDELFSLTDKQIMISLVHADRERTVNFNVLGDVSSYSTYFNMFTIYIK